MDSLTDAYIYTFGGFSERESFVVIFVYSSVCVCMCVCVCVCVCGCVCVCMCCGRAAAVDQS